MYLCAQEISLKCMQTMQRHTYLKPVYQRAEHGMLWYQVRIHAHIKEFWRASGLGRQGGRRIEYFIWKGAWARWTEVRSEQPSLSPVAEGAPNACKGKDKVEWPVWGFSPLASVEHSLSQIHQSLNLMCNGCMQREHSNICCVKSMLHVH